MHSLKNGSLLVIIAMVSRNNYGSFNCETMDANIIDLRGLLYELVENKRLI